MELNCIPTEVFVHQDILDEVTCLIGSGVLNDPVVLPCTHRFCRSCITAWLQKQSVCPTCRKEAKVADLRPDEGVWRIVCSYKSKCANKDCTWQGKYGERAIHMEKYCEFTVVSCDFGCGTKLARKGMAEHLKVCEYAPVECPDCGTKMKKTEKAKHGETCPAALVDCPNKCGDKVKRAELAAHLKSACKEVQSACKYSLGGCDFKGNKAAMTAHYAANSEQHLNLMYDMMVTMTEKLNVSLTQQQAITDRQDAMEKRLEQQEDRMRPRPEPAPQVAASVPPQPIRMPAFVPPPEPKRKWRWNASMGANPNASSMYNPRPGPEEPRQQERAFKRGCHPQ